MGVAIAATTSKAARDHVMLDIDKHPPPREHGEQPGLAEEETADVPEQIVLDLGRGEKDRDYQNRGNATKHQAGGLWRRRGDGKEDRERDTAGEQEPKGQRDWIGVKSGGNRAGNA